MMHIKIKKTSISLLTCASKTLVIALIPSDVVGCTLSIAATIFDRSTRAKACILLLPLSSFLLRYVSNATSSSTAPIITAMFKSLMTQSREAAGPYWRGSYCTSRAPHDGRSESDSPSGWKRSTSSAPTANKPCGGGGGVALVFSLQKLQAHYKCTYRARQYANKRDR